MRISSYLSAIIAGSIFLAVCGFSSAHGQTIEELKAGVVKITAKANGVAKIGTGIITRIEKTAIYILTAAHVIEGDVAPQVSFYSDPHNSLSAEVIGMEGGHPKGLAVLRVQGNHPSGLRIIKSNTATFTKGGEAITIIGFPRIVGVNWAVTEGTVTGLKGPDIVFSGTIDEGNSGGPLLIDGKVVGIVTEAIGQFGYATPMDTAEFALQGWGVGASRLGVEKPIEDSIPIKTNVHIDIYSHQEVLTLAKSKKLQRILKQEGIPSRIIKHVNPKPPDAIFIGALVDANTAKVALLSVPYKIRYLFRPDYPELEGGDSSGLLVGVGYMSSHYQDLRGSLSEPVKVSVEDLAYLTERGLTNTEFQRRLRMITRF